jgi:hypothetical protein
MATEPLDSERREDEFQSTVQVHSVWLSFWGFGYTEVVMGGAKELSGDEGRGNTMYFFSSCSLVTAAPSRFIFKIYSL